MNINDIKCEHVTTDLQQPFKTAVRTATYIETMDVTIKLENGVEGIGAATSTWKITGESLQSIEAAIMGPIKDVLIGRDIKRLNANLLAMEESCKENYSAKAAADIALHDVYAKFFQLPLYALLGGEVNTMQTDITIGLDEPEKMGEEAKERLNQGFSFLKIKVGNDVATDIQRIKEIKSVAGEEVVLRLDANQGWNAKQAIAFIQEMEKQEMNIEFVEQPVPQHDMSGLKFVKNNVNTPIMADESIFSPIDAFQLLKNEAVDLLNIKLMKSGGVRRAKQIADVAESMNIPCMMGSMMESSVSVTAAAHLAISHPNIISYDLDAPLWLKDEVIEGGIHFNQSEVWLTDKSGLGIAT